MTAKTFLSKAERLDKSIERLMRERKEIRAMMSGVGAATLDERVQSSGAGEAKFVRHVEKLDALEEEIDNAITACLTYKLSLHSALERMSSQAEADVLRMRYIDRKTWDEIAAALFVSVRTAQRLHGAALQHFHVPETFRD